MNNKNYLNKDNEELYILHFPGSGIQGHEYIINDNLTREITIDSNLSIISIMNKKYWDVSPLRCQCENNNIKIYNSALEEKQWNNTLKINYILKSLQEIETKYVLILDGRDVVICNNLDRKFIEKFKTFNYPIIYNGTPCMYPEVPIETLSDIIQIKGKQKYLNAGVCLGRKDALIDFYTRAEKINRKYPDNDSEQFIIRLTRESNKDLAFWDTDNKIFRIIHQFDTNINQLDENTYQLI